MRAGTRRAGLAAAAAIAGTTILVTRAQPPGGSAGFVPLVSIMELMQRTITPATNQLWSAYNEPSTPAEWQAMEEAAITLLAAASLTGTGGTGAFDNEWVSSPAWQAYNSAMVAAGRAALEASRARDIDGLLAAGDVLLPPCEGCHPARAATSNSIQLLPERNSWG